MWKMLGVLATVPNICSSSGVGLQIGCVISVHRDLGTIILWPSSEKAARIPALVGKCRSILHLPRCNWLGIVFRLADGAHNPTQVHEIRESCACRDDVVRCVGEAQDMQKAACQRD